MAANTIAAAAQNHLQRRCSQSSAATAANINEPKPKVTAANVRSRRAAPSIARRPCSCAWRSDSERGRTEVEYMESPLLHDEKLPLLHRFNLDRVPDRRNQPRGR